jgi:hypothetical protein
MTAFRIAQMVSNGAITIGWNDFKEIPNLLLEAISIFQEVKKAANK